MCRAHPRSRGENEFDTETNAHAWGSSPLTRGKPVLGEIERAKAGLIPAHAGKTSRSLYMVDGGRAHPRSRGENRAFDVLAVGRMGSSPLTRGKLSLLSVLLHARGLIPAHAGKT